MPSSPTQGFPLLSSAPRILIVEDDPSLVENYQRLLESQTISRSIRCAHCLDLALQLIEEDPPDVILLDLNLPDSQGLGGLQRIQECHPNAAIVIITGNNDQDLAILSLRNGAQDFLVKGRVDAAVLIRAVRYAFERKQSEDRVRSAMAEVEYTVRSTRAIFISVDPKGYVLSINDMAEEILGYPKDEVLGRHITEFVPANEIEHVKEAFRLVVEQGQVSLESRILTKTGEERFFIWHNNLIVQHGRVVRISAIGIDLTDRQKAEEQLRISRELLSSTLDAIPAFIAILDETGTIVMMNRSWGDISLPSNPLIHNCQIGTHYADLCDQLAKGSGSAQETALGLMKVISGSEDIYHADCELPDGDNSLWFEVLCTRFHIAGASHTVVMHSDITDRKLIENRLRVSEELFTIINNNMVDLLSIIGPDGQRFYTSSSYSSLLGYTPKEMYPLKYGELCHPEDKEKIQEQLRTLFTLGYTQGAEFRLRHKNGTYLFFESNGALISENKSDRPRAIVIARNITSRKTAELAKERMEILLHQAQKLESIGQLAAGIAHEINTPTQYIGDNAIFLGDAFQEISQVLASYQTFVDHVKSGRSDPYRIEDLESVIQKSDLSFLLEEIPKAIRQCLEGVSRVTKIVGAMKEFSHPSGDTKSLTNINRAIESTVTVCRNEWKYVADMVLELDPELPTIPCHPGEFNQAILNLVINAAQTIAEKQAIGDKSKGRISIQTRQIEKSVEIQVSDTGMGIPEPIRSRIFDPFFTTKPVGKGTGQGLAIVHSVIVEKHGGQVLVESEPGVGTTFMLRIPAQEV